MSVCVPSQSGSAGAVASSFSYPVGSVGVINQRLPTDPLFYANITLQNIVTGSRYWVAKADDLTTVLATGIAASSEEVLENMPAYTNPMLIEVRVRKGTAGVRYEPLRMHVYLGRDGAVAYLAQIINPTD